MFKIKLEGGRTMEVPEKTYWHTSSHILAQAIKRLYPEMKLAIGPAIDNGYYYDFDTDVAFTPEMLEALEKEMNKIIKEDYVIERFVLPKKEALELMKDEPYKVELINDLPEGEEISFYKQGEFVDLCAGPHLPSTGKVKYIKLLSSSGAYWRGDEHNKMLQRIYGISFPKQSELDNYINMIEEAKKRDHKKLGKQLELFMMAPEGPGFPFFLPKGMALRNVLEEFWRKIHIQNGYKEIKTPVILNEQLWHTSGHWDHYKDNMYTFKCEDDTFAIKPMNCPGGMLYYMQNLHSYKEFPLRVGELGKVHRHEASGTLSGLLRVRCFTQDDAHIFMLPTQIEDEVKNVMKLVDEVYKTFGLTYTVELSTMPENHIGELSEWELAETALANALKHMGLEYKINAGDGAFYGPKIDIHVKDCIGREWQCGTIQLDMQLPKRFNLTYIDEHGEEKEPIMIHRVIYGSIERMMSILIENFAGAFPTWLSPVQVKILNIADAHLDYAKSVKEKLEAFGIRCELDDRNEKIGKKIREAQLEKVPYSLIVGDNEMKDGTVSVRKRKVGDTGAISLDEFIKNILVEISTKALD